MNPIVKGYYADPEARIYDGKCWVFCTLSYPPYTPLKNTDLFSYEDQCWFDAFVSEDFVTWKKVDKVLTLTDLSWGTHALWAPSQFKYKNKYYLTFSSNDIQEDNQLGGLGIAEALTPEGPYRDVLGRPLVGNFINGAQPIDVHAYIEENAVYLFYGGWGNCNLVKMNDTLDGFVPDNLGKIFKNVTPKGYVEAPFMMKKDNKYYFMWSEGDWTTADYRVVYAIADNLAGPFKPMGTVLKQDGKLATGSGHHSVVEDPKTGNYYIFYHRRSIGEENPFKRELCMDQLVFNDDGTIAPVTMS
ncbi:glycoside hydrolase family 43 protein [Enterococcus camelliae]|uniref:Glycoside hydrolase family 43 protein n=1 Tax=Enterococcus camelliae TaxID=453959 RepID=A0ABW5TKC3_9ENTE